MNRLKLILFIITLGVCIIVPGGILGILVLYKIDPVSFTFLKNKIPFLKTGIKKIEDSDIYKKGAEFFKKD